MQKKQFKRMTNLQPEIDERIQLQMTGKKTHEGCKKKMKNQVRYIIILGSFI